MDAYIQLAGFIGVGILFGVIAVSIPQVLSPKFRGKKTLNTYECGVDTIGSAWMRFSVAFYVFALIFVAFEVDILYLFPIALAYESISGWRPFAEIAIFLLILSLAIAYAWRRKVFQWENQ